MASLIPNTQNVRLGVCRVFFGGEDMGFTKGGVDVDVTTNTSVITVDQFGDSQVDEVIKGRMIKVKAPFAETTLKNMSRLFPGANFIETGAAAATGSITITTNPASNDTVIVNGVTLTFKTSAANQNEVTLGATAVLTATALAAAINNNSALALSYATASTNGATAIVNLIYKGKGTEGNAYTLNAGTAGAKLTLSGATLSGGVNATASRVDVSVSLGSSLLASSKQLRLHPAELADTDQSQDVIIPRANTPGSVTFAFKIDQERVFNVEFIGYPDPNSNYKLFSVGDPVAV